MSALDREGLVALAERCERLANEQTAAALAETGAGSDWTASAIAERVVALLNTAAALRALSHQGKDEGK